MSNLEHSIKSLLERANATLKKSTIDDVTANELRQELLNCAVAATTAGFPYSAIRLKETAQLLGKRLKVG